MPYRRAKVMKRGSVTIEHFTDDAPRPVIAPTNRQAAVRALREAARLQVAVRKSTHHPCEVLD